MDSSSAHCPATRPGKWGCRFGEATIAVYSLEMRSIIPFNLCNPDWSSCLCADPQQARETRRKVLAEAAERRAWVVPAHFMGVTGMQI